MSIEPQQLPADCRRARDILARVGDKWTILLLMVLGDRRMRFTELHRAVNGISERMLTVTLRNLEHDGIDPDSLPHDSAAGRIRTLRPRTLAQACAGPDR
jgi:hypothetical protein